MFCSWTKDACIQFIISVNLSFLLVQIQLKGNMNLSPDIVLALGVSGTGRTILSPDRPVQTYDWLLKRPFCIHIHVFLFCSVCQSILGVNRDKKGFKYKGSCL